MTLEHTAFRVTAPKTLEAVKETLGERSSGWTLVEPVLATICQADLRYYFGRRPASILKKKYPMALLHEGVVRVLMTRGRFFKGDLCVLVPNIACHIAGRPICSSCAANISENVCSDVTFLSSNADGLAQDRFFHPRKCLAKVPRGVPVEAAIFTELLSVSYRAIRDLKIKKDQRIAVFGDGPTGYLCAALLAFVKKIPKDQLFLVGRHQSKLSLAKDFAQTIIDSDNVPKDCDIVFECVGKKGQEDVVAQALSMLKTTGTLMLLGVCEEHTAIKTRPILEKGILIRGSTRSSRKDFPPVLKHLKKKDFQEAVMRLLDTKRFKADLKGLEAAFKRADDHSHGKKVLIEWDSSYSSKTNRA